MITFQQTGIIDAPLEKVFSTVADFSKIPLWRKDIPQISHISGETAIGSTFVETVNFMGKNQLLMKVIEFIPNKKLVIEGQKGMDILPTQTFEFYSEGSKTKIDLKVTLYVSGFFRLIQFILPSKSKKTWSGYFVNLNNLLSS